MKLRTVATNLWNAHDVKLLHMDGYTREPLLLVSSIGRNKKIKNKNTFPVNTLANPIFI